MERWGNGGETRMTPISFFCGEKLGIESFTTPSTLGEKMMNTEKPLFHYTTIKGLQGIVENRSIWATDTRYLNDFSENSYSKKILRQELINFCKETPVFHKNTTPNKSPGYHFLKILEENIQTLFPSDKFSFYVCSFSEQKDLLSQWRGYGQDGTGFSLGFNINKLSQCLKESNFDIRPCIYEEEKQKELMRALIKETASQFMDKIGYSNSIEETWDNEGKFILADFMLKFIKLAPTLKHPKFEEEKEWRVIASLQTQKVLDAIKIRSGTSMLIPYIEILLPTKNNKLVIEQIVIGPTMNHSLSEESVKLLFDKKQVTCHSLDHSAIPYRQL